MAIKANIGAVLGALQTRNDRDEAGMRAGAEAAAGIRCSFTGVGAATVLEPIIHLRFVERELYIRTKGHALVRNMVRASTTATYLDDICGDGGSAFYAAFVSSLYSRFSE